GIVGLPNVGKSTLFNALTNAGAQAANYPFCTVEPNVGVVPVPDARLRQLAELVQPKQIVPAMIEFVDIAGLVKGASQGEGLGNQFLSHIREVDAMVHVIRCFEDPDVTHVMGPLDPTRDHDIITAELALADLAVLERRLDRAQKTAKSGDKDAAQEVDFIQRAVEAISSGKGARTVVESADDKRFAKQIGILTAKPILYAANVAEDDLADPSSEGLAQLKATVQGHHEEAEIVPFSAKFESELAELSGEERAEFLAGAGIEEPGLDRLVRGGYRLLHLQTFLTVGPQEVRAWTVPVGATAFDAAGEIHSDFQRGFIRAETIHTDEFLKAGSYKTAREQGLVRSEGRDYVVVDGDILLFRFNV
ncbi:MAG: redox-regulated ATPase YchF, partial [Gemmatimonadota bacterium]|nr:redox-regulated ATPase YchF [Gemmatimonadota bacterium]